MMTSHSYTDRLTPRRRRAFTLIELLVVVTIIVVLLSMLMPAIRSAQDNSYVPVCANQLHQISIGLLSYATEHSNMMPPGNATSWPGLGIDAAWNNGGGGSPMGATYTITTGYITDIRTFYCPAWTHPYAQYDTVDAAGMDPNGNISSAYGGWPAPGHAGPTTFRDISYIYRSSFGVDINSTANGIGGGKPPSIRGPLSVVIMSDHWFSRLGVSWATYSHRSAGGGYNAIRLDGGCNWFGDPDNQYMIGTNIFQTQAVWGLQEKIWKNFFLSPSPP